MTVTCNVPETSGAATDVAVMVAVPGATPVTKPVGLTVAIASSSEAHVTDLSSASAGRTSADNCNVKFSTTSFMFPN